MSTILSIVENAYRATLEEQDDAALWFNGALRKAGTNTNLLLQKNAVHYAMANQRRPRLVIGDIEVENPPEFDQDLLRMIDDGAKVYVVLDDLDDLGLKDVELIRGVETIPRSRLAEVTAKYDQVWWW